MSCFSNYFHHKVLSSSREFVLFFKLFSPQSTQLMEGLCPLFQIIFAAKYSAHGRTLSCFSNCFRRKVLNSSGDFVLFFSFFFFGGGGEFFSPQSTELIEGFCPAFQIIFTTKYSAHGGNLSFFKLFSAQSTQLMEGICPVFKFFSPQSIQLIEGICPFFKLFSLQSTQLMEGICPFFKFFCRKVLNLKREFVLF